MSENLTERLGSLPWPGPEPGDPTAAAVERELRDGTFLTDLANRLAGVVRDARDLEAKRRLRDDPCRWAVPAGEVAGRPCPMCGHVNLLHPGANPDLETCLVCDVDGLRRSMVTALREDVTTVAPNGAGGAEAEATGDLTVDEALAALRRELATRPAPGEGYTPDAAVTGLRLAMNLIETVRALRAGGAR